MSIRGFCTFVAGSTRDYTLVSRLTLTSQSGVAEIVLGGALAGLVAVLAVVALGAKFLAPVPGVPSSAFAPSVHRIARGACVQNINIRHQRNSKSHRYDSSSRERSWVRICPVDRARSSPLPSIHPGTPRLGGGRATHPSIVPPSPSETALLPTCLRK